MAQKTPISMMNELCKANNIVPVYQVVEETGPPHEKQFKVELNLPDIGTYEGIAKTIKGAKHKAAQMGLESCGLTKPEKKPKETNVAPSVQLNSLAMRHGKVVEYHLISTATKHPGPTPVPSSAYSQYGGQFKGYAPGYSSYGYPRMKVNVVAKVGDKEYLGEGFNRKEARYNAAKSALLALQKELGLDVKVEGQTGAMSANAKDVTPDSKGKAVENSLNLQSALPIKSEISQVYEIAAKRKMKIDFEVVSSSGPPHDRVFVTTVTVGDYKATGEGPGKKASKYQASIKILEELSKLPPLVKPTSNAKGQLYNHGGYGKRTPKELDTSLNPISFLGQLRQRRKESLPIYTLVAEEGIRNREFTIQVQVDSHTARGSGANKKEAKKNAAEAMLQLLGIRSSKPAGNGDGGSSEVQNKSQTYLILASPSDQCVSECSYQFSIQGSLQDDSKETGCMSQDLTKNQFFSEFLTHNSSEDEGSGDCREVRQKSGSESSGKKAHYYSIFNGQKLKQEDEKNVDKEHGSEGSKLPPGLLPILPEMASRTITPPATVHPAKPHANHSQQTAPTVTVLNRAPGAPVGKPISDEILQNGSTPSMKKLQQLAESGGFQIQYQNTTQENNEQCLAVVSISTVPPLICRGLGPTMEAAFEHAAANALVPLLQPAGPPNGSVVDSNKAPGARNIHVGSPSVKEEPTGVKPMV